MYPLDICIFLVYKIDMHNIYYRNRQDLIRDVQTAIESRKLTQVELSRLSNVCQSQISRLLSSKSGRSEKPSKRLIKLCIVLDIRTKNASYDPIEDKQVVELLRRAMGEGNIRAERVKKILKALAED